MAQKARSATERALKLIEKASRVQIQDLQDNIGARTLGRQLRKKNNQVIILKLLLFLTNLMLSEQTINEVSFLIIFQAGHTQGALERAAKPPLGWIWGDFFRPWQRMFPGEKHFNADIKYSLLVYFIVFLF